MRTDTERLDFIFAAMDDTEDELAERMQAAYTLKLRGRAMVDAAMGAKLVEPGEPMPELTAIDLAVAELGRIRNVKGFSEEMDDALLGGPLCGGAAAYLLSDEGRPEYAPSFWPDSLAAPFKPSPDDPKRELTKGIALALCELDRLIRAERRAEIEAYLDSPESRASVDALCEPEVPTPREFKVGDRVRVIGTTEAHQGAKVGALGTIREAETSCPWVEFDEPTGYPDAIPSFGIPAGYGDAVLLRNLEHVDG
jgi:hypothetical protein